MKKISLTLLIGVICFGFIATINAAESNLDSIATLTSVIGGTDAEIVQTGSGTYKYYYKIVPIDDSTFQTYVGAKYVVDNGDDNSDEYVNAQTRVTEYETTFNNYIAELSSSADLSTWTESTDKNITVSDISYEEGKHHGYVLGVAAVKSGDTNTLYVTRVILESTSATTLGSIEYNENDASSYSASTSSTTTTTDTETTANPETGIEDYAIYLVPLSLVLGSGILIRRVYA